MSARGTAPEISLEIHGCTDTGLVRSHNEDSFGLDRELRLMAVADGMGGHRAGEVASAMAVSAIVSRAKKTAVFPEEPPPESGLSARARSLESLIKLANSDIRDKSLEVPQYAGMGTTVAAVWAGKNSFAVAHVGDSRVYLFKEGRLSRLTEDHSWARERVVLGLMTEAEAAATGLSNVLTRALGTDVEVAVGVGEHELRQGDVIILATDGLTKMVSDAQIAAIVSGAASAQGMVQDFIAAANAAGGVDNVTVVAARAL